MANGVELERALFLNRLDGPLPDGYDRLYFGAAVCPWLLPEPAAALVAGRAAHERGWRFTLATPVLVEPVLPRLRSLLERVAEGLNEGDEILISDWGALALVRELLPGREVVLGRALSGQKRGPRILDLDLSAEPMAYFRRGRWHGREGAALLAEQAIVRVELDNLLQGLAPLPDGLRGSLHYPYAMVTSTRNCPFQERWPTSPCAGRCGEVFSLRTEQTRVPLLQGGNTQFLRNDPLPEAPLALGIDRLVHHPVLPR
jgi:hypothetical protein